MKISISSSYEIPVVGLGLQPKFQPSLVRCVQCGDLIRSSYPGEFVSCKCGAISVDQTVYYSRYIGHMEDFEFPEEEEVKNEEKTEKQTNE